LCGSSSRQLGLVNAGTLAAAAGEGMTSRSGEWATLNPAGWTVVAPTAKSRACVTQRLESGIQASILLAWLGRTPSTWAVVCAESPAVISTATHWPLASRCSRLNTSEIRWIAGAMSVLTATLIVIGRVEQEKRLTIWADPRPISSSRQAAADSRTSDLVLNRRLRRLLALLREVRGTVTASFDREPSGEDSGS
jgi:hypothetical protein